MIYICNLQPRRLIFSRKSIHYEVRGGLTALAYQAMEVVETGENADVFIFISWNWPASW